MSKLHRRRRDRADWTDAHRLQLATGHSYFPAEDWGPIQDLPPAVLAEVLADMAACWAEQEAVIRLENPHLATYWFEQFTHPVTP